MAEPTDLEVGQRVYTHNINGRRVYPARITHVARKLVTIVEDRFANVGYGAVKFRIDTQRVNDQYGHDGFWTEQQFAEMEERNTIIDRMHAANPALPLHGWGSLPIAKLRAIVKVLES